MVHNVKQGNAYGFEPLIVFLLCDTPPTMEECCVMRGALCDNLVRLRSMQTIDGAPRLFSLFYSSSSFFPTFWAKGRRGEVV